MVTKDQVYTAVYERSVNKYLITFVNYDGHVLQTGKVEYGTMPSYDGEEPSKPATAKYTYTFTGWTPELTAVTESAVYTAAYESRINKYTITFVNYNGAELQTSEVEYGRMPSYEGATPERPATAKYSYTFA